MNTTLNRFLHALATLALIFTAACATEMDDPDPVPDPPIGRQTCGDRTCDAGETPASCPSDCMASTCGNATCEAGETPASCPADCSGTTCGNLSCEVGETAASCPSDCTASLITQNNSLTAVWYLYVYACDSPGMGPDQLGDQVIAPNRSFRLAGIPAGCYRFRAVSSDSSRYWDRAQNTYLQNGQTFTWTLLD